MKNPRLAKLGLCAISVLAFCWGCQRSDGGGSHPTLPMPGDFIPPLPEDAIEVVLPEGETATVTVTFSTTIPSADIAFLLDSTGSMGEEIYRVRTDFVAIAETLTDVVPDAAFGVAQHRDYAILPYGGVLDFPFRLEQQITSDRERVVTSLRSLFAGSGGDNPESQYEALFQLASGRGFDLSGNGTYDETDVRPFLPLPNDAFGGSEMGSYDPATPGASTAGGMGFRPGAFRIAVHASDAFFRDPDSTEMTPGGGTSPTGKSDAIEALQEKGIHVIGVASGYQPVEPMTEVAIATGAIADTDGDGDVDDPLVYAVTADGAGLSEAITEGIVAMLTASELHVSPVAHGDTAGFVSPFDATLTVRPGEEVTFDVVLTGVVPASSDDQTFTLWIKLVNDDGAILDEQPIVVIVPAR